MKTYRNANWTARNYDCTNVVMQRCDGDPRNFSTGEVDLENWVEVDAEEVSDIEALTGADYATYNGFEKIGGFAGHEFFGHA